jgi:flagellar FliJ protein
MRFHYPLEKIVDLKSNEKVQAEWTLSNAVSRLAAEEGSLQQLMSQKDSLLAIASQDSKNPVNVSHLQLTQKYLDYLDHQILQKNKDVRAAQRNVSDKQENLTAKMQNEKVWLGAKEKAYAEHLSNKLKREQQELDEIAAVRITKR